MTDTPRTDALHKNLVKISEGPDWVAGKDYLDMLALASELEVSKNYLQERLNYAHAQEAEHMRELATLKAENEGLRAGAAALAEVLDLWPEQSMLDRDFESKDPTISRKVFFSISPRISEIRGWRAALTAIDSAREKGEA